jgi:hypothetical protein
MKHLAPRTRYALATFRSTLALMWSTAAAATAVAVPTASQLVFDPVLAIISSVISTLAGASSLAWRINRLLFEAPPEQPFVRPWLFSSMHMLGSWTGGVAGFLLARVNGWDAWSGLFAVLIMSFGGSKGLEAVAERWFGSVRLPGAGADDTPAPRAMPRRPWRPQEGAEDDGLDRTHR